MRDLMTLFGVIPEVADIFNQLSVVIDQRIVNRNDAAFGVARLRVLLQPRQTLAIEFGLAPGDFGHPAVETRLIGGLGKLRIDTGNILFGRHQQAGQVLGKVATFRLVGKNSPKLLGCTFDIVGNSIIPGIC